MALADAPKSAAAAPDLARLRIERAGAARRRRGVSPWFVVLLLIGAVGAWAYATGRISLSTAKAGRPVRVARIPRPGGGGALAAGEVKANGYVIARRRAALSTVLSGRLVEVNVEEGDTVKAGQVVARIQHDDIDAALASAKQAVAVAEARREEATKSVEASRLEIARLDADNTALENVVKQAAAEVERTDADVARKRRLRDEDAVSQDEYERSLAGSRTARAILEAAKAKTASGVAARAAWDGEIARREAARATAVQEVAKAEQALRESEILLEKTYVRAPFDGLVVHKDAEVGEVVAATGAGVSRGSVATIVDPSTLEAQIEMSETRLGRISEGDPTRIRIDAEGPTAPGYLGRVRQVWPTADRQKATVEIRVEFVEKPAIVKPEMGVTVAFLPKGAEAEAARKPEPLRVPRAAVVTRAGRPSVAVVLSGGVVRWVAVERGAERDGTVEIGSGLVGGETVVLDPPADLDDGASVRVEEGT